MRVEYLTLFLVVGAGVYLTRFLPLLLAMRREETNGGEEAESSIESDGWLRFVGPSIIAALLVTSLLPQPGQEGWTDFTYSVLALVPTVLVAVRFRDLGLTVLVGIVAYWLISLATWNVM